MKIAIWGSYNHGNYGDDIMAIQFAKVLRDEGFEPWVYRLNKNLADRFQIRSTFSLDELLDESPICFIGGGAMLESGPSENDPDFLDLFKAINRCNCTVFPVSVGGDGRGLLTQLSPEKLQFWTSSLCKRPSVRLTSDIAFLQLLGKKPTYHPDVLWTVQKFWKIPKKDAKTDVIKIGINIPNSAAARLLTHQCNALGLIKGNIVFYFIRTYLPTSNIELELLPRIKSNFIKHYNYSDPKETLEFISGLDLLVSHKLHLGLTALALDVPFLSLGGKGKTKSFLREIGADFAIHSSRTKNTKLFSLLTSRNNINNFNAKFNWQLIQRLKEMSFGHIECVKSLVASYK